MTLPPHPSPPPRPPRRPHKPKAATVPKPPTKVRQEKGTFYEEPYPGYKKPADLQAQAHQQAVDAQSQDVAMYQQQLAQIAANAGAKSSWQQQVGAALAQALAGLGPPLAKMGKQFGASQRDFASSLVAGMGAELGADAGGDNAILGAIDAPAGQAVGGSAGAAGDVLFATGGDIPATQMEGVGAAMAQELGAFPQIALNTAKNQVWATNEAARQDSQGPQSALQKLAQDQPSLAQEYYDQLVKEQQGYQTDYEKEKKDRRDTVLQLYNMGLATQQDVAYAMGLPDWKRYPKTGKQSGSTATKRQRVAFKDGSYGSYDPSTGFYYNARGQHIDPGKYVKPDKPGSVHGSLSTGLWRTNPDGSVSIISQPKTPPMVYHTVKGHLVGMDASGNIVMDYGPTAGPKTAKSNLTGKNSPYLWNERLHGYQLKPGYAYGPGGIIVSTKKQATAKDNILGPGGRPMTDAEINSAAQTAKQGIYAVKTGKGTMQGLIDHFRQEQMPQAIWAPLVAKAFGVPRDLGQLKFMNVNRLHQIATLVAPDDFANAVKPRKGGWSKQELIGFITGHLPLPKGEAPAETGATLLGYARQQLGQPYVWGGESRKEGGFDCSGLVDYAARQMGYTGPRLTTYNLATMGVSVPKNQMKAGDLIITHGGEHVVMYAGNGQVIAAPHTGTNVQMQPLSQFKIEKVRRLTFADKNPPPGVHAPVGTPNYRAPKQQVALAQKYGRQYGVDPGVLLAIAGHETQYGTLGAGRNGYTLGYGVTDSGILSKYRGVANQYRYAAQTLAKWGVRTIHDITAGKASAYASDPNWERGVADVYWRLV